MGSNKNIASASPASSPAIALKGDERHKAYQIIRQEAIRRLIAAHEAEYAGLLEDCKAEGGLADSAKRGAKGNAFARLAGKA